MAVRTSTHQDQPRFATFKYNLYQEHDHGLRVKHTLSELVMRLHTFTSFNKHFICTESHALSSIFE